MFIGIRKISVLLDAKLAKCLVQKNSSKHVPQCNSLVAAVAAAI
jgi:hypothetical protein